MAVNDTLADSMSKINNGVKALNKKVTLKKSKLLIKILDVLKDSEYIGSYSVIDDGKQGLVEVEFIGTINACGVIKPRYPVKLEELESYEKRFLPAKDFGVLIISTNKGLLTQNQAREQKVGGTLVAYCY